MSEIMDNTVNAAFQAELEIDDRLKRCTICGFIVDTKFAAEKPTIDYSTAGRGKRNDTPAPPMTAPSDLLGRAKALSRALRDRARESAKNCNYSHARYMAGRAGADRPENRINRQPQEFDDWKDADIIDAVADALAEAERKLGDAFTNQLGMEEELADTKSRAERAEEENRRLHNALATVMGTADSGQHMTWEERCRIGRDALDSLTGEQT